MSSTLEPTPGVDALRQLIGRTMIARFELSYREHDVSYDPDTVWEAADDVAAALAAQLLGQPVTVLRSPGTIGCIGFHTGAGG